MGHMKVVLTKNHTFTFHSATLAAFCNRTLSLSTFPAKNRVVHQGFTQEDTYICGGGGYRVGGCRGATPRMQGRRRRAKFQISAQERRYSSSASRSARLLGCGSSELP